MPNVLFVCTGNTCRSPMAEAIWRQSHSDGEARSAGLSALPGEPAASHARAVVPGLEDHRARQVDEDLVSWADTIYCMTAGHRESLLRAFPQAARKTRTLLDGRDVEDPYGGSLERYEACARNLRRAILELGSLSPPSVS